jgi:hypothetical protein
MFKTQKIYSLILVIWDHWEHFMRTIFFYLTLSMYSMERHDFNHVIQPIKYKTLYQTYVWYKMYFSRFYFNLSIQPIGYKTLHQIYVWYKMYFLDVISLEWGGNPNDVFVNKYKMLWGIVQCNILYKRFILEETVASKFPPPKSLEQQLCIWRVTAIDEWNVWMNVARRAELFWISKCYLFKKLI